MSDEHDPEAGGKVILLPGLRLLEGEARRPPPEEREEGDDRPIAEVYEEIERFGPPSPAFLQPAVEAVLFASDKPLRFELLQDALGGVDPGALRGALTNLTRHYESRGAGIRLVEVAGGYQLRTVARAAAYVARARGVKPVKLSKAAVETLSIVAYRQPVTRLEVEGIRGVDCGGMLRMLLERGLVKVLGRRDEPGRPLVYGTTPEFLEMFGLRDLSDLPTLRDLRELQADDARSSPVPIRPDDEDDDDGWGDE